MKANMIEHPVKSQDLLAEYGRTRSEPLFRELVERYVDLVYSTACRLVDGDTHRAQDITQIVFVDLSRAAGTMSSATALGGWLHRHTCFVASKVLREERRRQLRERQAAEMNAEPDGGAALGQLAPLLDEAINELGEEDRRAILLRFYEHRDLRAVGEALGSSENAAQKRVARALEQLRWLLTRRGVTVPVGVLGTMLAAEAVTAAPIGLAANVAAAVGKSVPIVLGVATMTKTQLSIIAAIVLAGVIVPWTIQQRGKTRLLEENEKLSQQMAQSDQLRSQIARLSNELAQPKSLISAAGQPVAEVLRLRGEVGRLLGEKRQLQERLESAEPPGSPPVLPEGWRPRITITNVAKFIPKAEWAFSGNATPDTALQSAMWALRERDWNTFCEGLTSDAQKRLEETRAAKPDYQLSSAFPEFDTYFVALQEIFSENEVCLTLGLRELPPADSTNAPGVTRSVPLIAKKFGSEWKLEWPMLDW